LIYILLQDESLGTPPACSRCVVDILLQEESSDAILVTADGRVYTYFCKKILQRLLQPTAGAGIDIFSCKRSLQRLLQRAAGARVDIFTSRSFQDS
jgi:hypothetical protein